MAGGVLLAGVMRVVGHDRRDAELPADLEQAVADPALDVQAVLHQLEEVVFLAEDVLPLGRPLERLVELAEPQPGLQLARRAAGGSHQPGRVRRDDLLVHPRPLDQPALGVGAGGELEQVMQAFLVPRPDGLVQVGPGGGDVVFLLVRLAPQDPVGVAPGFRRHVGLDPDYRRDAGLLGLPVELRGGEHVAVVGHRHVCHALALDFREQVLQPGGTVQHGVLGVHVQVSERRTGGCHDDPPPQGMLRTARSPTGLSWTARVGIKPVLITLVEPGQRRRSGAPAGPPEFWRGRSCGGVLATVPFPGGAAQRRVRRRRRPRRSTDPSRSCTIQLSAAVQPSIWAVDTLIAGPSSTSHRPGSAGSPGPPRCPGSRSGSAPAPWRTTAAPPRTLLGSPAGPAAPARPGRAPGRSRRTSDTSTTASSRSCSSPSWPSRGARRNRPAAPGTGTSPPSGARPARRSAPPGAPAAPESDRRRLTLLYRTCI